MMTTWYNGDDDHVEHVVEQQGDADGHQDKLALVLWLLFTNTMSRMMTEMITIRMINMVKVMMIKVLMIKMVISLFHLH